jgi:hypothetical protein
LTKTNRIPPCPAAPYSASKSLPKVCRVNWRVVYSQFCLLVLFWLVSFCRNTYSFLWVLHYQRLENYHENLLLRMNPPRPTRAGTRMKSKVLKEPDRQAFLLHLLPLKEPRPEERGSTWMRTCNPWIHWNLLCTP